MKHIDFAFELTGAERALEANLRGRIGTDVRVRLNEGEADFTIRSVTRRRYDGAVCMRLSAKIES